MPEVASTWSTVEVGGAVRDGPPFVFQEGLVRSREPALEGAALHQRRCGYKACPCI